MRSIDSRVTIAIPSAIPTEPAMATTNPGEMDMRTTLAGVITIAIVIIKVI